MLGALVDGRRGLFVAHVIGSERPFVCLRPPRREVETDAILATNVDVFNEHR